jgi:predicted nucleic acid-binding protein
VADPHPRAVLDTNVLISALLAQRAGRATPPLQCFELAARGTFRLVTSPPLVTELPGERPEHDRRGVHILGPREFLKALV